MNVYVYAIQAASGRIYVGQTAKIPERLAQHNAGRVKSTKDDRPWGLLKTAEFPTREEARYFEWCLKRSRGKRLRWLAS